MARTHRRPRRTRREPVSKVAARLGAVVRRHRQRRGESLATLAKRVGTDKGTLSRWERGLAEPRGEALTVLAAEVGQTPGAIWDQALKRRAR